MTTVGGMNRLLILLVAVLSVVVYLYFRNFANQPNHVLRGKRVRRKGVTVLKRVDANALTVGIVDAHNQVLKFWSENNKHGPLPLIHVDAHSDGQIPLSKIKFANKNISHTIQHTHIGDFIPIAQYLSLVNDHVIWIKPNWPGQNFNLPLGTYKGYIGERVGAGTVVCWHNHTKIDIATGKAIQGNSIDYLVTPAGVCFDDVTDLKPNRWDVVEFEQLWNTSSDYAIEKLLGPPSNNSYILDIDGNERFYPLTLLEDFFASDEPVMKTALFALMDIYLAESEYVDSVVGKVEKQLCFDNFVNSEFSGTEPSQYATKNRESFTNFLHELWYQEVLFPPSSKYPTPPINFEKSLFYEQEVYNLWCHGPEHGYYQLVKISNLANRVIEHVDYMTIGLIKNDYQFPSVNENCLKNHMCSSHEHPVHMNPSVEEIEENMKHVGRLLRERGAPSVITIARSLDGYTPKDLQPMIESSLLATIAKEIPNINVQYHAVDMVEEEDEDGIIEMEYEVRSFTNSQFKRLRERRKTVLGNVRLLEQYAKKKNIRVVQVFAQKKEFNAWRLEQLAAAKN